MGRIGNFFKRVGRGLKRGVQKAVQFFDKHKDTIKKVAEAVPSKYGGDYARKGLDYAEQGREKYRGFTGH
jgi:hypothetical protein